MNSIINNNKNKRKFVTYVIILPCYVSYRMYWSNRLPIMDCDEVYNYWEPLHYLQYNIGLQTWEYASSYALRTYMYLYPLHYFQKYILLSSSRIIMSLSSLSSLLVDYDVVVGSSSTKIESFLWMRSILGGLMGLSEVMFVSSLCYEIPFKDFIPSSSSSSKRLVSTTSSVCIGFVLLTSTGMCHASSAFLPSSTIMMMWLWCATAYTYRYYTLFCIIAITATLGVGWPFGVIVFIPMGLHILQIKYYQNEFYRFTLRIILLTILIQSMVMYIDYVNYGKVLSSTYNIFRYNAQQKGNDDLYGIEPLSYYIKNLFLNFNYISWIAFLGFWPISMYLKKKSNNHKRRRRWSVSILLMIGMPLYVWMTIVGKRPHKEERFLYPIYPSICVAAVVVIEQIGIWILEYYYIPTTATTDSSEKRTITKTNSNHTSTTITTTTTMTPTSPLQQSKHGLLLLRIWMLLWILPSCILSYSRVVALSKYYTAPTYIYSRLPPPSTSTTTTTEEKKKKVVVCTCGEWYRFPSSYYLDEDTMMLGFVESSFRGQLPKYFIPNVGSKGGTNFNDRNRYVDDDERIIPLSNLQKDCDYVIDLIEYDNNDNDNENELCGTSMITKNWKLIAKAPFLNARATSTLHRTIYLPFGYHRGVYDQYVLFGKE